MRYFASASNPSHREDNHSTIRKGGAARKENFMADKAHRITDEKLEEMEKRLSAIYSDWKEA